MYSSQYCLYTFLAAFAWEYSRQLLASLSSRSAGYCCIDEENIVLSSWLSFSVFSRPLFFINRCRHCKEIFNDNLCHKGAKGFKSASQRTRSMRDVFLTSDFNFKDTFTADISSTVSGDNTDYSLANGKFLRRLMTWVYSYLCIGIYHLRVICHLDAPWYVSCCFSFGGNSSYFRKGTGYSWRLAIYKCTLILKFRLKQVERKVVINLICLSVCIKSTYLLKTSTNWGIVSAFEF